MAIHLGSLSASAIKLGASDVSAIYLGATKVWPVTPGQPESCCWEIDNILGTDMIYSIGLEGPNYYETSINVYASQLTGNHFDIYIESGVLIVVAKLTYNSSTSKLKIEFSDKPGWVPPGGTCKAVTDAVNQTLGKGPAVLKYSRAVTPAYRSDWTACVPNPIELCVTITSGPVVKWEWTYPSIIDSDVYGTWIFSSSKSGDQGLMLYPQAYTAANGKGTAYVTPQTTWQSGEHIMTVIYEDVDGVTGLGNYISSNPVTIPSVFTNGQYGICTNECPGVPTPTGSVVAELVSISGNTATFKFTQTGAAFTYSINGTTGGYIKSGTTMDWAIHPTLSNTYVLTTSIPFTLGECIWIQNGAGTIVSNAIKVM